MNSLGMYENACRICLKDKVILNWNIEVFEFCDLTYKDCYYKFTQLDENGTDYFSSFLCEKCAIDLKNAQLLCENALESYKILMDTLANDSQSVRKHKQEKSRFSNFRRPIKSNERPESKKMIATEDVKNEIEDINEEENEIEDVNGEENEIEDVDEEENEMEDVNEIDVDEEGNEIEVVNEEENEIEDVIEEEDVNEEDSGMDINEDWTIKVEEEEEVEEDENIIEVEEFTEIYNSRGSSLASNTSEQKLMSNTLNEVNASCEINNAGVRKKKKTYICAYCSKTVRSKLTLMQHEAGHSENRIRTEACPDCGIKLYDKQSLYVHSKIHTVNRKKNYQCEFCDKAYFNRGSLNVHRRIHLGQMIKCQICKKEYARQFDLDKHMLKHSAGRIQKDVIKKKYLVHCKECNNQISVVNWKAHKASHLNQPQVKCKICNRDFYSRTSCVKHLKKVHKKTKKEEYDSFMHYYVEKTEMRTSHLMLKQQELVQPATE